MKRWGILLCALWMGTAGAMTVQAGEKYESDYLSVLVGLNSAGEVIALEPAILLEGDDHSTVWTSGDILEAGAVRYYLDPNANLSTGNVYDAEYYDYNEETGLCMFEVEKGQTGLEEDPSNLNMVSAYSDEVIDCYFFDNDFYEHHVTIQMNGCEGIDGLYFAYYEVLDESAFDSVSSVQLPGAMIDQYGDCVGFLLPQEVQEHDTLLFGETIDRSGSEYSETPAPQEGNEEEELIQIQRSRAGTEEGDSESAEISVGIERWESDGRIYIGNQKDGKLQGWGICIYEDNEVYVGEWVNGQFSGEGTYYWSDGDSYEGEFENDTMDGTGVYRWADRSYYTGQFSGGYRHGSGVYYDEYGNAENQTYAHGERVF